MAVVGGPGDRPRALRDQTITVLGIVNSRARQGSALTEHVSLLVIIVDFRLSIWYNIHTALPAAGDAGNNGELIDESRDLPWSSSRSWRAWRENILVSAEGRAGFIGVHPSAPLRARPEPVEGTGSAVGCQL